MSIKLTKAILPLAATAALLPTYYNNTKTIDDIKPNEITYTNDNKQNKDNDTNIPITTFPLVAGIFGISSPKKNNNDNDDFSLSSPLIQAINKGDKNAFLTMINAPDFDVSKRHTIFSTNYLSCVLEAEIDEDLKKFFINSLIDKMYTNSNYDPNKVQFYHKNETDITLLLNEGDKFADEAMRLINHPNFDIKRGIAYIENINFSNKYKNICSIITENKTITVETKKRILSSLTDVALKDNEYSPTKLFGDLIYNKLFKDAMRLIKHRNFDITDTVNNTSILYAVLRRNDDNLTMESKKDYNALFRELLNLAKENPNYDFNKPLVHNITDIMNLLYYGYLEDAKELINRPGFNALHVSSSSSYISSTLANDNIDYFAKKELINLVIDKMPQGSDYYHKFRDIIDLAEDGYEKEAIRLINKHNKNPESTDDTDKYNQFISSENYNKNITEEERSAKIAQMTNIYIDTVLKDNEFCPTDLFEKLLYHNDYKGAMRLMKHKNFDITAEAVNNNSLLSAVLRMNTDNLTMESKKDYNALFRELLNLAKENPNYDFNKPIVNNRTDIMILIRYGYFEDAKELINRPGFNALHVIDYNSKSYIDFIIDYCNNDDAKKELINLVIDKMPPGSKYPSKKQNIKLLKVYGYYEEAERLKNI